MAKTDNLTDFLTDIADTIRAKKGTSDLINPQDFSDEIASIGGGVDEDIIFYDYDGTIVQSYNKNDFLALTSMPANPSHTGLTAQGWNWTLSDAKSYVENYGKLNIGQMYSTTSGLTEFDIEITKVLEPDIASNGFTVTLNMDGNKDWGDGSASDTAITHTYYNYGKYTITCDGTTMSTNANNRLFGQTGVYNNYYVKNARFANITSVGEYALGRCFSLKTVVMPNTITNLSLNAFEFCESLISITVPNSVIAVGSGLLNSCHSLVSVTLPKSLGTGSTSLSLFNGCYVLNSITLPETFTMIGQSMCFNCYALKSIVIPNLIETINSNAFNNCYNLTSIIIPNSVTKINNNVFQNCYNLQSINLPDTITTVGSNIFQNCYSLTSINIPNNITAISQNMCYACYSLTSVVIPSNISKLNTNAFSACLSMMFYDFTSLNSIPTLASSVFSGINALCKIIVPDSLYDEWIAATNWVTYADYIYKASEVQE